MKRIQKYQTNEKPYDGGTLPEIEVNAKLPTIGAYRQYVKSRNPDFQVSDDGQVIPTSGAVWRDFLNPSYTPDNFGIEEYSDYKTNYEAADDGNPNTRYMPTNLQYSSVGIPGLTQLMKIPKLIRMRKRLGLLKKISKTKKAQEALLKETMTFSEHVSKTSKVKDVVSKTNKVKEVVSNTSSKVMDKFNSIPTESKVATGAVVGGKIIYDALKDQTGGFQNFQTDGYVDCESYPNDPACTGSTGDTGNTGSTYDPNNPPTVGESMEWGAGFNMGGPGFGVKTPYGSYNMLPEKPKNWKEAGMLLAGPAANLTGLADKGIAAGQKLWDKIFQEGGFTHQTGGMQNAYGSPEAIQPLQQMQQMYSNKQPQPQMYQMKGSDQGTSLLDRIESTTRVKGGRLVPIGNGVAIEGNQHDVSKNDAIDGFTEGVEFAPGKAAEGGEVMANAQVNGNSGEYMFSEAMKLNGKFGYKKGLGPSIADGAKNILASDLPEQIEQEKLNRLALMQETNKPDTNEDGMAKNYEYSKYGGFPNKKYQSGDYEKYQSLGDLFSWNQGTITPYVPPVDPEADNPPNQVNLYSRKSLVGGQDLPVYKDDLGFPSVKIPSLNNVEPGQFKTLSEDEQIQIALNTTIPAKTDVKEKKKLPNLNVASTDNWDYGTIPGRQGKATTKGGLKFYNSDKDLEAFVNSEGFEEEWLGGIDQEIRESVGISSINDMNDKSKVRAYQKAWNAKNPNNKIQVDGKFGEQTIRTARLKSAEEVVEEEVVEKEGDKECGPGGCGDTEENLNNTLSTLDKIENKKRSRWGEGVNKMGKYLSKNGLDLIAGGIQLAGPIAAYKKPIRMATAVTAPGYRGSRVNYDSLIKQATDQGNSRKQTARNNITGPGLEQALAKIDAETQANIMKIKDGESNQNLSLQDSEAKINTQINQGNATAMNRIEELNTKNLIQHDVDKVEAIDRATNRIANVIGNYQDRKTREFSAEIISGETGVYTRMDFQKQTGMTAASNPEAYIQWLELNNPAMLKRLKTDKLTDTKTEETEENN